MMKTKLARAITLTLAGGALTMGAVSSASAASSTYYNNGAQTRWGGPGGNGGFIGTYNVDSSTDGFVWGGVGYRNISGANVGWVNPNYSGPALLDSNSNPLPIGSANFTGLAAGATPFGYQGSSQLNWAVSLGSIGDTATVSKANALSTYGAANTANVEVDTGAGAWRDAAGPTGWKHQTDIGLIKADTDMKVTINIGRVDLPSSPGLINDNFGVTIFTGMDTNTGAYSHHGGWNSTTFTANNPFGTSGVLYMKHDATVDTLNSISFNAIAGQVYSIYVGGAGVGLWSQNVSDYALNISTAPVPVPAAAWLFGGALMSLVGARRRKSVMPA